MTTGRIKTSLLSLPDELLSAIFSEIVRDDSRVPRAAAFVSTCRRLAPIVRQEVYRELRVGHRTIAARLLAELCSKRPDLRALVQGLHLQRAIEVGDDDEMCINYGDEHPGNAFMHLEFPALHTLSVLEATPADIFDIISRVSAPARTDIRKLILGCVPEPKLGGDGEHSATWWHLLTRWPALRNLTLWTTSYGYRPARIVFSDERDVSPHRNLHSLTLDGEVWDPAGGQTLAALFPTLQRLRVSDEFLPELETLLRQAPTSLTRLTLSTKHIPLEGLLSDVLARFPLLEFLSLCQIDASASLPSIRTSRIKHICLSFGAQLTDQDMRGLVDGPARMKHLEALELDYISLDLDCWSERDLKDALGRDARYDLAQVKDAMHPEWPEGCTADGLRAVMDAARKNSIKVYGTAVDCLDWSDRFDEQVERLLVDDALASNDYTTIERYFGEEGAGKAILRQRPRLAALIRKRRT
jgi:hypothetical protein